VKLEQASKASAWVAGQGTKEHMPSLDDGIAASNGSRPSLQWWIATPFESLVPSFVPKSMVTAGSFGCRRIPIRRVPVLFTTRPLFEAEGKECEYDETN
jgi:hypothetical protein